MNKFIFIGVIFLLLFSSSVFAIDLIELEKKDFQTTILPKGTSTFYLTIENNQEKGDSFRVTKSGVYWEWLLNTENSVTIPSKSRKTIKVEFTPISEREAGDYGILLEVESLSNSTIKQEKLFEIKVVSFDQALSTDFLSSNNINPNKDNLFRIKIKNNYDVEIEGITLTLNNQYFKESEEFTIRPYETKEIAIPIEFEGVVEFGDSPVLLQFYYDEELVLERKEIINIGEFTEVSGSGKPEKSFLFNKETIERTNEGNTISEESHVKSVSIFERLFTEVTPNPTEITREGTNYVYVWEFSLSPDETKIIEITTDYRLFTVIAIIIIILLGLLYYWLKRDLTLEKRVVSMRKGDDGYYSMNVALTLKNKTLNSIKNIKVMDRLGGRVDNVFNFGTREGKVFRTNTGKSTKVVWFIPEMEKRGEIVLHYTMKYKPHIIKSVPSAMVKYNRHGRPVFVKSNRAEIFN